jgi:hypothetical protein
MRKLTIKVDSGIAASYKVPGQYTKARANADQVLRDPPAVHAVRAEPMLPLRTRKHTRT